jgi:hypothetical protein
LCECEEAAAAVFCLGCTVRVCRQAFTLVDAIEFHAFAPLEALPRVWPTAFLLCVHSSNRLPLAIPSKH